MTSANITLIPACSGKYDIGIFRGCNNHFTLDSPSPYPQLLFFRLIHEPDFAEKLLDLQGKTIACMCESIETCHGQRLIRAVDWINEHGGPEAVRQMTAPPFRAVHPVKLPNGQPNPHAGKMLDKPHPRLDGWAQAEAEIESPF